MRGHRDWRHWLGALGRLIAFVAIMFAAMMVLAPLWQSIAPASGDAAQLLGSAVTAAAALIAGALLIRAADGRSPAALGIGVSAETPRHVLLGIAVGGGGLIVAVVGLLLTGSLVYQTQDGSAGSWIAVVLAQAGMFTIAALAEEAVFRGYLMQVLARAGGVVFATVITSVLFALAHGANPSIGLFALINIFLAGVLLAVAYLKTLSLWYATALHMGWNWTMATLFDLPVSGLNMFNTPLYEPVVSGAAWWSGAQFGPEGGLVGTLGFAAALAATLWVRAIRRDETIAAARPLMLDTHEGIG